MVDIDIVYEGNLRCRVRHRPSGTEIVTDAPRDNEGRGESFSPTDLVAAALGSCMVTILGIVARRHEIPLEGTRVHVKKEMQAAPDRKIRRLTVTLSLPKSVPEDRRAMLEKAALACPVHRSLGEMDIPVRFEYV